jgi:hypothetical protein
MLFFGGVSKMRRDTMRTRCAVVLVAATVCLFVNPCGAPARADLFFGNTLSVFVTDTNQGSTTPQNFLVNDTSITDPPEVNFGGGNVVPATLTVTDHLLYFKYNLAATFDTATFNGYVISDVSTTIPPITSFVVDPNTTLPGFSASRVTFDATDIFVNVSGLVARAGDVIEINVNPAAAVPEPSPLALIAAAGAASGAFGWVRRRAIRKQA